MRKAWLVIPTVVVSFALVACKKDKAGDTPKDPVAPAASGPLVADTATIAEADKLWALAPKGAQWGVVVTGKALVKFDETLTIARGLIARTPGLEGAATGIDEMRKEMLGTAASYAEAGIALERGAAAFHDGKNGVVIPPVGDRDKFVASHGGTRGADVDRLGPAFCQPIGAVYACATDAAFLALGGGDLGKQAGVKGVRGDAEVVANLPPLPPNAPFAPTGPLTAVLNIRGGELVVRANLPATLKGPLAELAASPKAKLDPSGLAGLLVAPLGYIKKVAPDAPLVTGVTLHALLGSFAGPLQAGVPAGAKDVDVRVPLADPAPATTLVAKCDELKKFHPGMQATPAGGCQFAAVPALAGVNGELWVEGSELRVSKAKGPAPKPTAAIQPSAAGRELAGYTAAFWGRGLMIASSMPDMPPQMAPMMTLFSNLNELGMGVDFRSDGLSFLLVGRTIHANPYPVFVKLDAALASGDPVTIKAIVDANPGTPIADDYAAGFLGLTVPSFAVGMVAAVAIPAFLEYMRAGKKSEADVALSMISRNAKMAFVKDGAFPVGKAGPTPAKSCCDGPDHLCAPDPAAWGKDPVWTKLEFAVDEPHRYQYRYEGTAKAFTAVAEADLDCDAQGTTIVTAKGSLDPSGNPVVELTKTGTD